MHLREHVPMDHHKTLRVERRKLVGVSANRLRDMLGPMAALYVPTRGRVLPRWQRDGPQPRHRDEQPEATGWRATAPVEGPAQQGTAGAWFRAEIRPVAPMWSEVLLQVEYAPGAGPLAWLAARTVLRWRLGAGLNELVRAMGRCTAPDWAQSPAWDTRVTVLPATAASTSPKALREAVWAH